LLPPPEDSSPPAGRLVGALLTVTQLSSRGNQATAVLHYRNVSIASIVLRRSGGAWRIATRAQLGLYAACIIVTDENGSGAPQGASPPGAGTCPPSSRRLQFVVGHLTPVSGSLGNEGSTIPIPVAVQRAGGRELSEFVAGAGAFTQSGCEGCHQLAGQGNQGPGPALDGVGSRLSERQLVHALADPRAPMPSFKNLPPGKFQALVTFLSLLRSS